MRVNEVDALAKRIHEISTSKGFKAPDMNNLPEKLMLSVSELAEALEEHRSGKPLTYWKCEQCGREQQAWPVMIEHYTPPGGVVSKFLTRVGWLRPVICDGVFKYEGVLVELADSTIRNLHMMWALIDGQGLDDAYLPSRVIGTKVNFNSTRPSMHGGRKY